jgi:hypothetical protein
MDLGADPVADRVADAERRATAAEDAAREASERVAKAERAATRRERAAESRASAEAEQRAREEAERAAPARRPVEHYDDLAAEEVIALLASLEQGDLRTLREYERVHANRPRVLSAIDSVLARSVSRV